MENDFYLLAIQERASALKAIQTAVTIAELSSAKLTYANACHKLQELKARGQAPDSAELRRTQRHKAKEDKERAELLKNLKTNLAERLERMEPSMRVERLKDIAALEAGGPPVFRNVDQLWEEYKAIRDKDRDTYTDDQGVFRRKSDNSSIYGED